MRFAYFFLFLFLPPPVPGTVTHREARLGRPERQGGLPGDAGNDPRSDGRDGLSRERHD